MTHHRSGRRFLHRPRRQPLRTAVGLVAFCGIAFSGCTSSLAPEDRELERIRAQRAIWSAQEISDYTFESRRVCFCAFVGWLEVTVRADTVESITAIDDPDVPAWALEDYPTVDGLFDILEDAVDRNAVQIDVTWHDTLGYPTTFFIDYALNIADEELGHDVRVLTPEP